MRLRVRYLTILKCVIVASYATRLPAQVPAKWPFPNVNKPVAIAPAETVQVLNITILDFGRFAQPRRRFDVQYKSRIDIRDASARDAQADLAAEFFGVQALDAGAQRLMIALCDTKACGETFEGPRVWYLYERDTLGRWTRAPSP